MNRAEFPGKGTKVMKPHPLSQILDRKRYDTETATLLSGNDWWDGHNWERSGRNTFLYRSPRGAYFAAHLSCIEGEADRIEPLTEGDAITMFEAHAVYGKNRMSFDKAFPGIEIDVA